MHRGVDIYIGTKQYSTKLLLLTFIQIWGCQQLSGCEEKQLENYDIGYKNYFCIRGCFRNRSDPRSQ
jgi:hypothetical protein